MCACVCVCLRVLVFLCMCARAPRERQSMHIHPYFRLFPQSPNFLSSSNLSAVFAGYTFQRHSKNLPLTCCLHHYPLPATNGPRPATSCEPCECSPVPSTNSRCQRPTVLFLQHPVNHVNAFRLRSHPVNSVIA